MRTSSGLRLHRRAAGAVAVLVAGLVAGGCGGTANAAATVDGHAITQSTLDSELHAIAANAAYVAAIEQSTPVKGAGLAGTVDLAFADKVLTRQILYLLVHDEVARRHLVVTAAELKAAADAQRAQIGADQRGAPMFDQFSPSYQDLLARRGAEVVALQAALANVKTDDAAVQQYYDANRAKFTLTCVSHILVNDKATADRLRARLVAGGPGNDFASLARANSTDTQSAVNGGSLGCQPSGTYVPEFEAAVSALAAGQLSQPVQTQFGWHLIEVTDRKAQALADVKTQIIQQLQSQGQTQLTQFIQDAVAKAAITINPRYGTFAKSGPNAGVVPPNAPPASVGAVTPEGVSSQLGQSGQSASTATTTP